jgi:hypothetical protein
MGQQVPLYSHQVAYFNEFFSHSSSPLVLQVCRSDSGYEFAIMMTFLQRIWLTRLLGRAFQQRLSSGATSFSTSLIHSQFRRYSVADASAFLPGKSARVSSDPWINAQLSEMISHVVRTMAVHCSSGKPSCFEIHFKKFI